jgi:hypothetical protein
MGLARGVHEFRDDEHSLLGARMGFAGPRRALTAAPERVLAEGQGGGNAAAVSAALEKGRDDVGESARRGPWRWPRPWQGESGSRGEWVGWPGRGREVRVSTNEGCPRAAAILMIGPRQGKRRKKWERRE